PPPAARRRRGRSAAPLRSAHGAGDLARGTPPSRHLPQPPARSGSWPASARAATARSRAIATCWWGVPPCT
ncbi:MAG: hypothetical protein ACK559_32315, partial [bacterium]